MAVITFGNNLASLNAQRRLTDSSTALRTSFERLSSGLRINHAADDAAGLSISSGLNIDARVFTQAVRNINDGTSLLNVADGALSELENVAIRLGELTEQAANGTLSLNQRRGLNTEATALVSEYNRIVSSTTFNNINLLNGNFGNLDVQAGYGSDGKITFGLGTQIARNVWDGTLGAVKTFTVSNTFGKAIPGDFNGDGKADFVTAEDASSRIRVYLGNGDGTFNVFLTQPISTTDNYTAVDLNNDGKDDLITTSKNTGASAIYLSNGDGSFALGSTFDNGNSSGSGNVQVADFNNDGKKDFVISNSKSAGSMKVYLGNGDGTFGNVMDFGASSAVSIADYNGDGVSDLISTQNSVTSLRLGNANGTFRAALSLSALNGLAQVMSADLNNDGIMDFVGVGSNYSSIFLGNENGTFSISATWGSSNNLVKFEDFNGDGITDILTQKDILLGNGNGTVKAQIGNAFNSASLLMGTADFNSDGVLDILGNAVIGSATVKIRISGAIATTTLPAINISSQLAARNTLGTVNTILRNVVSERGKIGAQQARLQSAMSNLAQASENLKTAASRIVDADIADESATLVKNKILQQAGLAVLAQANSSPELALSLLTGSTRFRR